MKESIIYQDILEEGRIEGIRQSVINLGKVKLGKPNEGDRIAIEAISDAERLDRMLIDVLTVATWSDLLSVR